MEVKHRELKIAWANGAILQRKHKDGKCQGKWFHIKNAKMSIFNNDEFDFRVRPNCQYAHDKIHELGGQSALDKYKHWIGGGELFFSGIKVQDAAKIDDPFQECLDSMSNWGSFEIKKEMKTQVLWVYRNTHGEISRKEYFDIDKQPERFREDRWHKVPTCTREVEV